MPIPDLLSSPYTCPALTPGWPTAYSSYREIAYRDFPMSDVQSSSQYQNPNPETPNGAMINGSDSFLSNGFDHFAKSHFAISEFLIYQIPISETSMPPVLCTGCATCRLAYVTRGLSRVRTCHVSL
jgi:hypothetical protein